jgi:hypothetical protein
MCFYILNPHIQVVLLLNIHLHPSSSFGTN